jgi:hypothetical protein
MKDNFDIYEWRIQQALKEAEFDPKKSDLNKDGKLSSYEKKRGEAIAKNMDEQPAKMVHDAEDLEEDYSLTEDDWMQRDDESDMAHSQLYAIKDLAGELCNMIDDGEQLDAWVQAKLTKAEDYLNSVYRYLSGEEAEVKRDIKQDMGYEDDVILGAQFMERRGDTDFRRAKAAKRLGTQGEKKIFGSGVADGKRIEKEKLSRRK